MLGILISEGLKECKYKTFLRYYVNRFVQG